MSRPPWCGVVSGCGDRAGEDAVALRRPVGSQVVDREVAATRLRVLERAGHDGLAVGDHVDGVVEPGVVEERAVGHALVTDGVDVHDAAHRGGAELQGEVRATVGLELHALARVDRLQAGAGVDLEGELLRRRVTGRRAAGRAGGALRAGGTGGTLRAGGTASAPLAARTALGLRRTRRERL